MLGNERIVGEMGISTADAIDLFGLAGREIFVRIETPAAGKQTLAREDFIDAGDAAMRRSRPCRAGI